MSSRPLGIAGLSSAQTSLAQLRMSLQPPKPARTRLGRWLQEQWAMAMLRRDFAKRGVRVWELSDEEFKAQLREGLRRCVEMLKADAARRALADSISTEGEK